MSENPRVATRADIPAIHRVRLAVRENVLTSVITEADYIEHLERTGRGWVIEVDGEIVAFAVANKCSGNIWALFVDPRFERRGYGRRLHDVMLDWLWSRGLELLWLTTCAGTRAQGFYGAAGWTSVGMTDYGELRLEKGRPSESGQ